MKNKPLLILLLVIGLTFSLSMQVVPGLYILTPEDGQVVSGTVDVRGSLPEDDFGSAELAYSFNDGDTPNWFTIIRLDQPVHDATLGFWDTTTISDGTYRLKLVVYRANGDAEEVVLQGIQVANYTHIVEPTAAPVEVSATPTTKAPVTQQATLSPGPTQLPENPASIDPADIRLSLTSGVVLAVLMLIILGVYSFFRGLSRK